MKKIQGKIILAVEHCEDQDIQYKAYVMRDLGPQIEIIDYENLNEWMQYGGDIRTVLIDRSDVINEIGTFDTDLIGILGKLNRILE